MSDSSSSLTVVIPCYNEADNIPRVIPEVLAFCREHGWRLILVNDGSKDNSAGLLAPYASESCRILTHRSNRGYGAALKSGLAAVETEYAVTIDSDGQHDLKDVGRLLELAVAKNADMVVGCRPVSDSSRYRRCGKWIIRTFAAFLIGRKFRDLNAGMKLYRTDTVRDYLQLCPDGMSFSDIILLLIASDRHLVLEESITIHPRTAGHSTIGLHTAKETLFEILNIAMLIHPQLVFSRIGTVFLLAGVAWGIRSYCYTRNLSTGSGMLLVTGCLIFMMGLLGEQVAQVRRMLAKQR